MANTRVVVFGLLLCSTAHAGPWVDDRPGHGFAMLSYGHYSADSYFAGPGQLDASSAPVAKGSLQPIRVPYPGGGFGTLSYGSNYVAQDVTFYGEVSVSRGFALVLSLPMFRYLTQDVGAPTMAATPTSAASQPFKLANKGVGDLVVGLKYQLPRIAALRGFAFGPQLYFTAPTGDESGKATYPSFAVDPQGRHQAPLPLPTGNGTADVELRGSFGYSFHPIPVFMTAELGYHHHFDRVTCTDSTGAEHTVSFSDDLPWNVQVGATWSPKKLGFHHATLVATLRGTKSFENGDVPGENGAPLQTSPYTQACGQANNMSYLSLGGSLMIFPLSWIGVTYSIEHTLLGVNTGYGLSHLAGVAVQF